MEEENQVEFEEMRFKSLRENRDVGEVMQAMGEDSSDSDGRVPAGGGTRLDEDPEPERPAGWPG